ncbi:very short patch repair endonuclease [Bacteroides pyogenes]|uniref:very short patch repair endonuclease n=1 Tax=Bacteroides pyogenes TaxID=310300 RepID=UPI002A7EEBB4|nr:very short patch repair endonuclease [Bacteroides pyogenes]MDY4250797.1 very short patch repair endonuclease [Bacteroides pyogenes]
MVDKMTSLQRHRCMSSIPSRGTKLELIVRKYLFARGFRYRINDKRLPGSPDIVLKKYKTVIFVNGCFWHGHDNCANFRKPKSNVEYWDKKIKCNKQRDVEQYAKLRSMGWHVIRIWECQLKKKNREKTLNSLVFTLNHLFLCNISASSSRLKSSHRDSNLMIAAEDIISYKRKSKKDY